MYEKWHTKAYLCVAFRLMVRVLGYCRNGGWSQLHLYSKATSQQPRKNRYIPYTA